MLLVPCFLLSQVDAAKTLQLCEKPNQCRSIPTYPLRIQTAWSCPIFSKCTFKTSAGTIASSARTPKAPKVDEMIVRQYPKIVGSQVAMPLYQFTKEHATLEAARRLLAAGANSFKFDLKNQATNGKPIMVSCAIHLLLKISLCSCSCKQSAADSFLFYIFFHVLQWDEFLHDAAT
jgi:hypothetical protein